MDNWSRFRWFSAHDQEKNNVQQEKLHAVPVWPLLSIQQKKEKKRKGILFKEKSTGAAEQKREAFFK